MKLNKLHKDILYVLSSGPRTWDQLYEIFKKECPYRTPTENHVHQLYGQKLVEIKGDTVSLPAMKTDCFYVYDGKPVAIEKLLGRVGGRETALVRHIIRDSNKHGDISDVDKTEEICCDDLQELTTELAKELIAKYNRTIGQCNRRIHAFNECLQYM